MGRAAAAGTQTRAGAALLRALRQLGVQPAAEGARRDASPSWTEAPGTPRRWSPSTMLTFRHGRSPLPTVTATVAGGVITGFTVTSRRRRVSWLPSSPSLTPTGTGALARRDHRRPARGGIRKFVDTLPGLGPGGAQQPRAVHPGRGCRARARTAPGCGLLRDRSGRVRGEDALGPARRPSFGATCSCRQRSSWRSDPAGESRRQSDDARRLARRMAVDKPHYLGPIIVAKGKVAGMAAGGRREAGSHHVLQPASQQCRRRKPLHTGGRDGSGFRGRTGAAGRGRRQVHAEPGDHPPSRQQHRVDQRRQHPPVDHAGK